jgi:hypothetical protein
MQATEALANPLSQATIAANSDPLRSIKSLPTEKSNFAQFLDPWRLLWAKKKTFASKNYKFATKISAGVTQNLWQVVSSAKISGMSIKKQQQNGRALPAVLLPTARLRKAYVAAKRLVMNLSKLSGAP